MAEQLTQIEVTVSWGGNPLHSALLTERRALVVGPSSECWFSLPESVLPTSHELIVPEGEGFVLSIPEGAVALVVKDGAVLEPTAARFAIEQGMVAEVKIGAFAFYVRPTAEVKSTTPKTTRSYGWMRWLAVAAVLHMIILGMFAMSPPDVAALNGNSQAISRWTFPTAAGVTGVTYPFVMESR